MTSTDTTTTESRPAYEFDAAQNRTIIALAGRAALWGILSLAGGVVCLAAAWAASMVPRSHGLALAFVVFSVPQISVGVSFLRASRSLRDAVETEGHDVTLLLEAIDDLTAALRVQIAVTVLFVGGLAALAWWTRLRSG